MLNYESSEAKRIILIEEKIISKRSEHVYIEEFKYRSEANRFDSDFVFKKSKNSELYFVGRLECVVLATPLLMSPIFYF